MILQALYQYQKRQEALGRGQKLGCAEEELKFLIEISERGEFRQLLDLRETDLRHLRRWRSNYSRMYFK